MKRRWIIRGFFIGLLLLCIGGWVWSYLYEFGAYVYYSNHDLLELYSRRGEVLLAWSKYHSPKPHSWGLHGFGYSVSSVDPDRSRFGTMNAFGGERFLGFWRHRMSDEAALLVPNWFPTTTTAALLWLVWRKTRPKPVGRAFPVEAKQTVDEKTP